MTKTHRTEVIEEYDEHGKLVRKTTTEETEESNDMAPVLDNNWWQQPLIRYNKYAFDGSTANVATPKTAYTTDTSIEE